jgi:general secretion pathway protein G
MSKYRRSGFTLVEILIVVIILGILAAIVIPQFTNASEDARKSSLTSQLQTIRSQVELFKLQHRDRYPLVDLDDITSDWDWNKLTTKTNEDGVAGGNLGPYLQAVPKNNLNGLSAMAMVDTDADAASPPNTAGWVFSRETGKIWATNKDRDALFAE